jgi:hypothetical protein|tara:strand:- start:1079 stop:1312 length:234 start_codon:yes stop_codon:yes gene_type:complete
VISLLWKKLFGEWAVVKTKTGTGRFTVDGEGPRPGPVTITLERHPDGAERVIVSDGLETKEVDAIWGKATYFSEENK